ncbi:flagellar motor switch protein FliN [Buchnera aphidicola]|uniref:flagellar motor switch protein FliN n=1 Tax=Buchnera aphidicola TaxID=9 RepID=UPI0002F62CC2|nr:flagellar motor switch protein FliN [Buchnera aphidicola]
MNNKNKNLLDLNKEDIKKSCEIEDKIFHSKTVNDVDLNLNSKNDISSKMKFIMDVPVHLTIEVGTVKITIKDLLELRSKSILVLDKHAGDPLNILVNGYVIATGELVVTENKYGIRIINIIDNSVFKKL